MPSYRRRPGLSLLTAVLVSGSLVALVPAATAAPSPTVGQVQRRVEALQAQAEQASEDFNEAREHLASITVLLTAAQARLRRQDAEVTRARAQVGRLAAETYRLGPLSGLDVVLGDSQDAVLARTGYLPSVGDRQSGALRRLAAREARLARTEADIRAQRARAQAEQARMRRTKQAVERDLARARSELRGLRAAQRRRLARAQARVENAGLPRAATAGGPALCHGLAVQAPTGRARTAIRYACAHLGDPYVWAAAGPRTFDCSGLTMRAYGSAGVPLPHSSRMQAGYGRRVPTSQLAPGDLVFFHSPISHVGIYLGNGLLIHAPHTGDVVRIARIWTTPSAAVRLD